MFDAGTTVGQDVALTGGWRAMLVLREELTAWDIDLLVAADLAVLQQLTEVEAALAAPALGLSEAQGWMSRISPEMVAVTGQGGVRWALLAPTAIERGLLPPVGRFRR